MSKFLLIHTSLDRGFAALTNDGEITACLKNTEPKEHGSFLHDAIAGLFRENDVELADLDAIGVTGGPGSYTGIRVGLSAVKGLAYAGDKPVVVCSNLEVMTRQVIRETGGRDTIYIPMIHARKEEFYTGYYRFDLSEVKPDEVVDLHTASDVLSVGNALFFGIGIADSEVDLPGKIYDKKITKLDPRAMNDVTGSKYTSGLAVTAADATPIYLKDAYITKNHKLHI